MVRLKPHNTTLALLIKERRTLLKNDKGKPMTQEDLSRKIGFGSVSYICMVESGLRWFEMETLPAVSRATGIPVPQLVKVIIEERWPKEKIETVYAGMFETFFQLASLQDSTREHIIATIANLYEREQQKTVTSRKRA